MVATDVESSPHEQQPDDDDDIFYSKELARPDGTSPICQFFAGSSIFLTGVTGFMGKVFLQKVMRCAPDLKAFYVLVRSKKGKEPSQRLDEIFEDKLFDCMKDVVPAWRSKVHLVVGDISETGLGLSDADRQKLCSNVDIIIHGAATVRFDEALKKAITINVRGTKEMFDLAHQMPHLKVITHISTAYCHCVRPRIEEKFYEPVISYEELIQVVETLDDAMVDIVTPHLLGDYPNTYTFSKSLAESIAMKEGQDLPLVVFRPSIVTSTYKDPLPSWTDNLYGPMGIALGSGLGLLRIMQCKSDLKANLVPVDMTVNALMAATWDKVCNKDKNDSSLATNIVAKTTRTENNEAKNAVPIYNFVCCNNSALSWDDFKRMIELYGDHPIERMIWYYVLFLVPNRFVYLISVLFLHWIPAILVDIALKLSNNTPMMLRAYLKIHKFLSVTTYFSLRSWEFPNQNVLDLWSRLDESDKKIFFFDCNMINWHEYYRKYMLGARKFVLKEDKSTIPAGRRRWNRLYWMHQGLKFFLFTLVLWIIF